MRELFVGVDVAKAEVVVACQPEGAEGWTASNDAEGIAATVARLTSLQPRLIVLEATGGYERMMVAALAAAGLPVVVANRDRSATSRRPPARGKRIVWGWPGAGACRTLYGRARRDPS